MIRTHDLSIMRHVLDRRAATAVHFSNLGCCQTQKCDGVDQVSALRRRLRKSGRHFWSLQRIPPWWALHHLPWLIFWFSIRLARLGSVIFSRVFRHLMQFKDKTCVSQGEFVVWLLSRAIYILSRYRKLAVRFPRPYFILLNRSSVSSKFFIQSRTVDLEKTLFLLVSKRALNQFNFRAH